MDVLLFLVHAMVTKRGIYTRWTRRRSRESGTFSFLASLSSLVATETALPFLTPTLVIKSLVEGYDRKGL